MAPGPQDPRFHDSDRRSVEAYCFGDLPADQREAFELHLLTCDTCFREVEQLMEGVAALRNSVEAGSRALSRADVAGLLGVSSMAEELLSGHTRFVLVTSGIYGLLHGVSVLTELSYFLDRHGATIVWAPLAVFGWMTLATVAALAIGDSVNRHRHAAGLLWSIVMFVVSVSAMLAVEYVALPHEPSIAAAFRPRTVAVANLRNTILYAVPLGLLFIVIPFHQVTTLQRELAGGRHENVLQLLAGNGLALTPRGMVFVRPAWLAACSWWPGCISWSRTSICWTTSRPAGSRNYSPI
jgi:anti-sigma factor RsiW